jgi:hypothetical protein
MIAITTKSSTKVKPVRRSGGFSGRDGMIMLEESAGTDMQDCSRRRWLGRKPPFSGDGSDCVV